mmetsp:Transcript_58506/g.92920  ORF Transcript_58506/g.92920 Transcript_58506/m.92920 type:complete len:112 (+) Transcript_58506:497-832(+)
MFAAVAIEYVIDAAWQKDAFRTAHWTYAHELKYSIMSPMHLRMHVRIVATMHTIILFDLLTDFARYSSVRTKATQKDPKHTLPSEVVSPTNRLGMVMAPGILKYQRPNTPA